MAAQTDAVRMTRPRAPLTEGSITVNLLRLAVPIIISNMLQTAYQVVDTFWVGRLSAEAVAAVSFCFPVSFLLIALGGGLPIAGTVLLAQYTGRGEGVPIARYDQSTDSVFAQIESIQIIDDLDRDKLQQLLPAGAARNALDCALWDLEAERSGKRAWDLANIPIVDQVETSFTISLDTPAGMADAAAAAIALPVLKLKLCGDDSDLARVEAVRAATPKSRISDRGFLACVFSYSRLTGHSISGMTSASNLSTNPSFNVSE